TAALRPASSPVISVSVSATYQCCPSVPIISVTYQCHQSVPPIRDTSLVLPISAAYQCPSVPPISAHQCRLSVPISAASSTHISEGEKLPV
ncbi:unnamed protein product, partial [Staurois parvus]